MLSALAPVSPQQQGQSVSCLPLMPSPSHLLGTVLSGEHLACIRDALQEAEELVTALTVIVWAQTMSFLMATIGCPAHEHRTWECVGQGDPCWAAILLGQGRGTPQKDSSGGPPQRSLF